MEMEEDLNRSLRMLDEVMSKPSRGLLKPGLLKDKLSAKKPEHNLTIVLTEEEKKYLDNQSIFNNITLDKTLNSFVEGNKTLTGSVIQNEPWKNSVDILFTEFLEILQDRTNGYEILDIVSDLARCCGDALSVVKALKSKVAINLLDEEIALEKERNTWRLLFILYQDRLGTQALNENPEEFPVYIGTSEKRCIELLFRKEPLIRECQLVIDWLENCAQLKDDPVLHFSDCTKGWENTLYERKTKEFSTPGRHEMVRELDPDAPHREKLPLHDLDAEDENKLCLRVFTEIRCGKLAEAQQICINCGHSWRAALFEGWRLFHNPNTKEPTQKSNKNLEGGDESDEGCENMDVEEEKDERVDAECFYTKQFEGNIMRDVWKKMSFEYCNLDYLNPYEKAALASYCGHLKALLNIANTWEDFLWSYMKVMVDIRVESEIRDSISRPYRPLPEDYWNQRLSINEIFTSIENTTNTDVHKQSKDISHVIQKYIILNDIENLMEIIKEWLAETNLTTHFLRFLSHLVLFFEQIGQTSKRDVIDDVLELYVSRLMEMKETELVAFYVSKIGRHLQVPLYASYLENIIDNDERKEALQYADSCGMEVFAITKKVVENIRNMPYETDEKGMLREQINEVDKLKISAVDWVLFYENQISEALIQSNALIFSFLTLRKLDAARLVFDKIPSEAIDHLFTEGELSQEINQAVKEHLSYKMYLEAQEAFNVWFKMQKSKPICPKPISEDAHFTEKVAHQHQMSQYKAETERWKLNISHLAKSAKSLLYNVLLFPDGGWLCGARDADYLRSICIPECVLLLYSVLYESGMHEECVQLADILAAEKYGLYKVYSKEKLEEILINIAESSLALLHEKKDPWGNERTA